MLYDCTTMKGRSRSTVKSIRSILKILPYYSCSGCLAEIHGQFNSSVSTTCKTKKELEKLTSLYVLRYRLTDRKIYYETLLWTQLIYLTICNVILATKERFLNNTIYYQTKLSLLLNFSHHWYELTTNLGVSKEISLRSTWPWTKFLNSNSTL